MKKIFAFLLIFSTMIFIGCSNNVTNSNSNNQGSNNGGSNNNEEITKPDGLDASHNGTWYFYSEDGVVKGDSITIANGGITGLKTSSAIDFVKDNFNSKVVFDINAPASKNYVVYKDGYTGNINLNTDIAYIKIKNVSGNVIIEGMLSKTQKSTTIDTAHVGTYTATYTTTTGSVNNYKLDVTTDLVTFTRTSASGNSETYTIPASYFTKSGNSYTSDALNYPETVLDFDNKKFTIKHVNVNYSASDASFTKVSSISSRTTLSPNTLAYTKS